MVRVVTAILRALLAIIAFWYGFSASGVTGGIFCVVVSQLLPLLPRLVRRAVRSG